MYKRQLQSLRRLSDQASYYWQKDIVGYDQEKQAGSLLKWLNISSVTQQIIWLAGSAIAVLSILALTIWQRRRKRWHPVDLPLAQLSKSLSKHDQALVRHDNEDPLAWLDRVATALASKTALSNNKQMTKKSQFTEQYIHHINDIKHNYRQLRYGRLSTFDSHHAEYQRTFQQLKKTVRLLK